MPGRLESEPVPRRDFLGLAGLWSAGIAIAGSIIGMARLPRPRVLPEVARRFRAGKPEELTPGTVKILPKHNVRIVVTDQGITAMSMICTHLGCIVGESEEGFACPCHGSKFDARGNVVGGPAPRGLVWLAISQAADGSVIVDKDVEVSADDFYQV